MTITVATFAFETTLDKATNLAHICAGIDEAADAGADLAVFPEVSLQGYKRALTDGEHRQDVLHTIYREAESVTDGPSVLAIAEHARRRSMHVVYGLDETDGRPGRVYNSAVLTGPDGHIGSYRKVHATVLEKLIYQPGDDWPVYETPLGRIGVMICYDKMWPESARELNLAGAEIIIVPTAWPSVPAYLADGQPSHSEQYEFYDRVRAMENARWIITSNYAGRVGVNDFFGLSQIVDPSGHVVATTGPTSKQVMALASIDVRAGIESAYASTLGAVFPRDARPDTYGRVSR